MRKQKAEDIMTSPAITVSENTPVFEIAQTFTEKKINIKLQLVCQLYFTLTNIMIYLI